MQRTPLPHSSVEAVWCNVCWLMLLRQRREFVAARLGVPVHDPFDCTPAEGRAAAGRLKSSASSTRLAGTSSPDTRCST